MTGGRKKKKNGPLHTSISPVSTDAEDAPAAAFDDAALSDSELREAASSLSTDAVAQFKAKIAFLIRCDGAGEYVSLKFSTWLLQKHGITLQHSNAHQQHQNGMAEKVGDKLVRRMRAALLHSGAPSKFWGAAVLMAADVLNATPHTALDNDTPYHRQFGYHCDMNTFALLRVDAQCSVARIPSVIANLQREA